MMDADDLADAVLKGQFDLSSDDQVDPSSDDQFDLSSDERS
jgi:hypothetical protein